MKATLTILAACFLALGLLHPSPATGQTQTYPCETVMQFGTGMTTNGTKLRPGAVDPFFQGTDATFPNPPNAYVLTDPPAAWIANSASTDSQWIGPSSSVADDVTGTSVYRLLIVSPCAGARLTGRYAASDRGVIRLNGQPISFPTPAAGWTTWTAFSFNNLLPGLNRLEFYVTNTPSAAGGPPGPTGLRAELSVTATCCPCIVLDCPSDIFLTTCSNGAPANFSITGTNRCYTNLTINCSLASITGVPVTSGFVFPVGTNTVICNASDTAGHRTNCSFRVTVTRDTRPPEIRCPQDIVYLCVGGGTNVFYSPTATDGSGPNPIVTCVPPSGSFFPPGTNQVTCEARDACGNLSRCSFNVILAPNGFTKTVQAGVADNFALINLESPDSGPCLGASGYWTAMPFDTYFPGRHFSHSFQGLPNDVSAARLILHMKPRLTTSQDDVLRIGLQNCGGAGMWAFALPVASLPGAGGTWVTNPPTTFTLDLAALPGGVNLLASINANHRLEFAVGTETLVDYARLEVTYCGPQSTLSGVPYSLNNVRSFHQGEGISWRTVNSNGPPPTVDLDVGQADGLQFHFDSAFGRLPISSCPNPGGQLGGYEGVSGDWPTGNGTIATAAITDSVIPGQTRITMSQPWNTLGKAIEVWNDGQPVARYYLAGAGDTAVNAPSDECLFAMGYNTGYFFANFHNPISVQILTGQHVSGPTGGMATGDSIRLYCNLAVGPRPAKKLHVTLPPGGLDVAGISLLHADQWVKGFGPQQLTVTVSSGVISQPLVINQLQAYGVCYISWPGPNFNLHFGRGDFEPNSYVAVDYLSRGVNFYQNHGGLRLSYSGGDSYRVQNTRVDSTNNSILLTGVPGGYHEFIGATSLVSDTRPKALSIGIASVPAAVHFRRNGIPEVYTVIVDGQPYQPFSVYFEMSGVDGGLDQFSTVCVEAGSLDELSLEGFSTRGISFSSGCLTLTCPTNVLVNATTASGAVVNFQPTATTRCGSNVVITCEPPSGSVFPPGASVVSCTAIDSQGNQDQCRFLVTVLPTCPLTVTRLGGNRVELRWVGDAIVESAEILGERPVWRRVSGTPTSSGAESILVLPIDRRQQFFRTVPLPLAP